MTAKSEGAWESVALGEAVEFLDGQRRPVKATDRARMQGSVPYYGASGIVDLVNQYIFDEELILLGEDGENILSRVVPLAFKISGKAWVNNHAHVLRTRPDFDVDYLTAYLESLDYSGLNSGTAQPKLNKRSCLSIRVMKPPLQEQKRIAAAILDVNALAHSVEQLIAKKQAIKQGMMQQLLAGNTPLTTDKSGWTGKPLSELCDIRSGAPRRKDTAGANWIVDMGSITRDAKLIVTKRTNDNSGRLIPGELVMPKDDIGGGLIIGRTGLIPDTGTYVLADHVYALTSKGVNPAFLNLAINSNRVNMELRSKVTGSAQLGLSRRSVLEQRITLPNSREEQAAIAAVFADVDSEIEVIERRLHFTRSIKQGMMQELLTGRTRLAPLGATA